MLGQLGQQAPCFFMRQKANAPGRLPQHPNLRGPLQPLPLVDALAQNRAHQRQRPIHRGIAAAPRELCVRNLVERGAGDGREIFTAEEGVEPAQQVDSPLTVALCDFSFNHRTTASFQVRRGFSPNLAIRHSSDLTRS